MPKRLLVLGSAVLGFWFAAPGTDSHAQQPPAPARTRAATYDLADGSTIAGVPLNHERADDVQLRTTSGSIVLLRKSGARYRVVTSGVDWPSYDGSPTGNRYTPLTQIDKSNVGRLAPRWVYTIPTSVRLQVTPVVVESRGYRAGPFRLQSFVAHADVERQPLLEEGGDVPADHGCIQYTSR